jgi:hypothetical protein
MFLHPMVSVGHVVHCGASRAQNINTLFFLLVGGQYGFLKEHAGTRYAEHAFLHPVVSVGHVAHSGVFGARNVNALYFMLEWDWCCFHKSMSGQVTRSSVFASGGICRSHCTFQCVWGAKSRRSIFHAHVGSVRNQQKASRVMLRRTCILHPLRFAGHVVHCAVSVA